MQEFTNVAREVTRKRSEKFKDVLTHGKLVERVRCPRESSVMASPTRGLGIGLGGGGGGGGGKVLKELKEGYEVVKRKVDVLDVSVGQCLSFLSFAVSE